MSSSVDVGGLSSSTTEVPTGRVRGHLVTTERASVFLKRTLIGGSDRLPPCPVGLKNLVLDVHVVPPLYTLRYLAAQSSGFNYDGGDLDSKTIPAPYVRRLHVDLRAELLQFVTPGFSVEREEYGRVPIFPDALVNAMMLAPHNCQLPTPSGPFICVVSDRGFGGCDTCVNSDMSSLRKPIFCRPRALRVFRGAVRRSIPLPDDRMRECDVFSGPGNGPHCTVT